MSSLNKNDFANHELITEEDQNQKSFRERSCITPIRGGNWFFSKRNNDYLSGNLQMNLQQFKPPIYINVNNKEIICDLPSVKNTQKIRKPKYFERKRIVSQSVGVSKTDI